MSRLVRNELEDQNQSGLVGRLFNSVWVLVPLLALSLGTIVWAFWPANAETLFRNGSHVMETSTSLTDWEHAWDDYLDPPQYSAFPIIPTQEQVEKYRQQIPRGPVRR